MNNYIVITTEGFTFQPNSEKSVPDIENCQVIGFSYGKDSKEAFENLLIENTYLLETSFDELIFYKLASNYEKTSKHFMLSEFKNKIGIWGNT